MSMKNKNYKFLVYGGGGIGSYFAGALSKNMHNVTLLTRGEHYKKIKTNGLIMDTNWGKNVENLNLVKTIDNEYDVVILAVKTYSVKNILSDLKNLKKGSKILCIQNGTFTYNFLSEQFENTGIEVIDGLTWIDAVRKENGSVIQFGTEAKIIIGKNETSEQLQNDLIDIADTVNSKNIQFEYTSDISKAVWEKLIMVASIGSIMCYSNMDAKSTVNEKLYLSILEGMIIEMTNASISIGVNIDENYAKDTLKYILNRSENLHSSLKEEVREVVASCPVFKDWSLQMIEHLSSLGQTKRYSAGSSIMKDGEKIKHLYIIRHGVVQICKKIEKPSMTYSASQTFTNPDSEYEKESPGNWVLETNWKKRLGAYGDREVKRESMQFVTAIMGSGQVFGELAILDPDIHNPTSAIAYTNVELYSFESSVLLTLGSRYNAQTMNSLNESIKI